MSSIASTPTTQKTTMTPGWREAKFERRTSDEYSVGMAAIVKEDEEEEEEGVKMRWRLVGFWKDCFGCGVSNWSLFIEAGEWWNVECGVWSAMTIGGQRGG